MKEEILLFGKSQSLVGIMTKPQDMEQASRLPGVILLNAGLIHRVGPNRLYVKLARSLAEMGFVVLRFDFSGKGDSQAREDHLPFEQSGVDETQEAMNCLAQTTGIEQFLLIGHCSGAGFSFLTASRDARVMGTILINPQGGGEEWATYDRDRKLAQYYTNYYGKAALTDPRRWARFVKGEVDYRSIARNVFQTIIWNKISTLAFRLRRSSPLDHQTGADPVSEQIQSLVRGLRCLTERGVQILFIYSEGNTGLEFISTVFGKEWDNLLAADKIKLEVIPESDHLFTLLASQKCVLETIQNWAGTGLIKSETMPALSPKGV